METLDRDTALKLFNHYRAHRDGIRDSPEIATTCLICESVQIVPKRGEQA